MSFIVNQETLQYKEASNVISFEKLVGILNLQPTNLQDSLIDCFDNRLDQWSELNLVASRRSGKTFTLGKLVVLDLLKPHSSVILISKSSKSLTANFNEVVKTLKQLNIPLDKINSNTYTLTINGDSHLRCSVYKTAEDLLGARASLIILDECGVYTYKEMMEQFLAPMRIDYGTYEDTKQFVSKIVRVSSPRTIGSDFHIDYTKGLAPVRERYKHSRNDGTIFNGHISFNYNIYDSPLVTPTLIEALKRETKEEVWQTEYLGKFIHSSSINAFSKFSPLRHVEDVSVILNKVKAMEVSNGRNNGGNNGNISNGEVVFPLFIGVDIGLVDKSAYVAGTIIENKMVVIQTFNGNGMTTSILASKLKELIDEMEAHTLINLSLDHGGIYVDPSASLTRFDLANDYDVPNLPAFNKIKDGLNDINHLFDLDLIIIDEKESELIEQVESLAFKESAEYSLNSNTSGDPFVRIKGHHYDLAHAFRYLVASVKRYQGLPEVEHQSYDH